MEGWFISRLSALALCVALGPAAIASGNFPPFPPLTTATQRAGTVKQITIVGNVHESKEGILATMRTKVGAAFSQATLDQDKQTLFDLGVFKTEPLVTVDPNSDGTFNITVQVAENPIVKEIRVVGNTIIPRDQILKVNSVKQGEIFSTRSANVSARQIEALYRKKGYVAFVTDFSYLPDSPQTLNIQITEVTVSSVRVTGNTRTKKRVLDHLIKTQPGQPYNRNKWEQDLRRMYNTGWFDKIDPTEDTSSNAFQVGLGVKVREGRTGNFGLGLQVDPQSSLAGFIRYTDSNFKGSGQSLGASYTEGTRGGGPSVEFDYGNPFIDSKDTALRISVFSRIIYRFTNSAFGSDLPTNANQYIERRTGSIITFTRPINYNESLSTSTRFEKVNTTNLDTTLSTGFIQQDGDIASNVFTFSRNRRDVDIDASRGDYLSLNVEPGYSNITKVGGLIVDQSTLGSSFFSKFYGDYRVYFSPGKPRGPQELDASRHVFAFRIRAGTITGKIPFFEQFFAGGADTVRGYNEDRFWGKETLLMTAEYRYPLQKAFNLIGFVDYGGAWGGYGSVNTFTQYNSFRLHLGYGIGVSFRTPLGPIRIDYGLPSHGAGRTYFQIGTSF